MPNVRFDGAHVEGSLAMAEHLAKGADLGKIAGHSTCAMSLDVASILRVNACSSIHRPNQALLRLAVRKCDTGGPAILADACVKDDGADRVTSAKSIVKAFQGNDGNALATTVTRATRVKGITFAVIVEETVIESDSQT